MDKTAFEVHIENCPEINLLEILLMQVKSKLKNSAYRQKDCSNFYQYYFSAAKYLDDEFFIRRLSLVAENCGLRKRHTKACKAQMLFAELSSVTNEAPYYKRFVNLFLAVKSAKLKDFILFIERRER